MEKEVKHKKIIELLKNRNNSLTLELLIKGKNNSTKILFSKNNSINYLRAEPNKKFNYLLTALSNAHFNTDFVLENGHNLEFLGEYKIKRRSNFGLPDNIIYIPRTKKRNLMDFL